MLHFKKLWSVQFFHKYYKVQPNKDIQPYQGFVISPSASTLEKIESYGLTLKQKNGEFIVFYKEENTKPSLLKTLTRPEQFVFTICYNDSLFLNYSAIDLKTINECFLLQNTYSSSTVTKPLHPNEQLDDEQKVITIYGYADLDKFIENDDSIISVFADLYNNGFAEIFNGSYAEFRQKYPFNDLLQLGCLKLKSNESDVLNFYPLESRKRNLFAILELDFRPGSLAGDEPLHYAATIGAKHVTWRYNIVEKEEVAFSDFKIYAGKSQLSLKGVRTADLGNGVRAVVLETSSPIELCETYDIDYEVEYSLTDIKAGRQVSKKRTALPVPNLDRIKVSKNLDRFDAYSDMYIYL